MPLPERESCIYEGWVAHRRLKPVLNAFRYRVFLMYLDLDELPTVFDGVGGWSLEGRGPAVFRRADYHGDAELPLAEAVRRTVRQQLGYRPEGPIRLLTHLRYFGHIFNPVSFYYCFGSDGSLEAILAEITNTPWRERHSYALDCRTSRQQGPMHCFNFGKAFHVSPFMPMEQQYDWRLSEPGDAVLVNMATSATGGRLFSASMHLERREISAGTLRKVLWQYPLMTLKVVATIHWQALKLWLKGSPFYAHPDPKKTAKPLTPAVPVGRKEN